MIKRHQYDPVWDTCTHEIDLDLSAQPQTGRLHSSGHQNYDVSRCQLKKKTVVTGSRIRQVSLGPDFKLWSLWDLKEFTFIFSTELITMAVIDIRKMGRASPSRCPGRVEASRLQDTHSLRPFSAEETLLTALYTLTRQVAIFWEDTSLTWENFTRTNTVSCPAAGNHRTKCLLQLNPPLALIIFFKEKPLMCSHLGFKYRKCNFHQIHVPPLMASTSELERRSKSLGTR